MSPCLVQQLFRQKVGLELDPGLIDEVFFPLLRSMKHGPKELLLDIKLTSDILIAGEMWIPPAPRRFNILPFSAIPEHWNFRLVPKTLPNGCLDPKGVQCMIPIGERTSKMRRRQIRRYNWGTIDILNELRGLNYPQMGHRPTCFVENPGHSDDEFDDAYVRLEEDISLPPNSWSVEQAERNRDAVEDRSRFVNDFLEDALNTGKRLTWEGGVLGWEPCKLPLNPPFHFIGS